MPEKTSICHLAPAASISALEGVAVGLGSDRVGRAVRDQELGFDRALVRRLRGLQIAVDRDRRGDIGAVARQLQNIAAAETEADRGAPCVDQTASTGFRDHRVIGGADAFALLGRVLAQRIGELRRLAEIGRPRALPVHIGDEHDIPVAGHELGALDRLIGQPHPVRCHQHRRTPAGNVFVINQRPLGGQRAHGIFDFFGLHVFPPVMMG